MVNITTNTAQGNLGQEVHAVMRKGIARNIGRVAMTEECWKWDLVLEAVNPRLWKSQFKVQRTFIYVSAELAH